MRRSVIGTILATILILGAVGAVGYGVWNNGYNQGAIAAAESTTEVVVATPGYTGFAGYGFFGLFFGIFFLFLLFGLISKLIFGRRYWRGGPGAWGKGWHGPQGHEEYRSSMEQRLTDWHEEAHGRPPTSDT